MRAILIALSLCASSVVLADEPKIQILAPELVSGPKSGAVTISRAITGSVMFEMGPNGCLRGPMTFYDVDDKEVFKLSEAATYPSGCDKNH